MSDNEEPDFDIDNYKIEELLDIFNIKSPIKKEAIMKLAGELIKKYKQLKQSAYVEFFSKAMNKLLSDYHLVEGILGKADTALDNLNEVFDDVEEGKQLLQEKAAEATQLTNKVQGTLEDLYEKAEDAYEDTSKLYQDGQERLNTFLNPEVQDAGPNVLKNQYYNGQSWPERAGNVVMPDRGNYTAVPPNMGSHAPQLQTRLMMPNAFAQIPFAQGYRNPTLQNAFITWVNVDSQYREIKPSGTGTAACLDQSDLGFFPDGTPVPPKYTSSNIFAQNDSSTDFLYTLNAPITNVLAMTVGSIEVPMGGYYNFSDKYGNTTFQLTLIAESSPGTKVTTPPFCLKIPEGNYDPSGIKVAFDSLFETVMATLPTIPFPAPPSLDILQAFVNPSNQKIYFALAADSGPIVGFELQWYGMKKCGFCAECTPNNECTPNKFQEDEAAKSTAPEPKILNKKEYKCSDKNTGKKINSTLGWTLGFREAVTTSQTIDLTVNPVADAELMTHVGFPATHKTFNGNFGGCIWNQLGTKYLILEVDDFNRNRNNGNMGTMTMPSCTEKFKLPKYAKDISPSYPVCSVDASNNSVSAFPNEIDNDVLVGNPLTNNAENIHLEYGDPYADPPTTVQSTKKGYYETFKRSCRKGTPAEKFAVVGQDTLTKAQKYTAREITNSQKQSCSNQYFSPQSSNILFRFPIERLSTNLQSPVITPNAAGMANGRRYFGPVTIEKLKIRLLDDKGFPVDLNCGDFSFSLILERLYQY